MTPLNFRRNLRLPYTAGRLLKWFAGDRSPFVASLKLTTRCNLQCRHCPWTGEQVKDMPTAAWIKIISDLAKRGVFHLVLEGGEPTLREDLQEIICASKRMGMMVTVATNVTRSLDEYSPDRFLISIDGLEKTHDELRGDGAFRRMLENLSSARSPKIALVSLSKINCHQIHEILKYFSDKVEGFWFSFVYDYDEKEPLSLDRFEKQLAAREILALMNQYPIVNTSSFLKGVGQMRECRPWLVTTITADGSEQPGCRVSSRETCSCDQCDLPCHREISDFVEPRFLMDHFKAYLKKPWL
jgi:Fe-coproporphyrin III synthase